MIVGYLVFGLAVGVALGVAVGAHTGSPGLALLAYIAGSTLGFLWLVIWSWFSGR